MDIKGLLAYRLAGMKTSGLYGPINFKESILSYTESWHGIPSGKGFRPKPKLASIPLN